MKWCYFKAPFIFDGKMWDVRDSRHWPPRLPAVPAPATPRSRVGGKRTRKCENIDGVVVIETLIIIIIVRSY